LVQPVSNNIAYPLLTLSLSQSSLYRILKFLGHFNSILPLYHKLYNDSVIF